MVIDDKSPPDDNNSSAVSIRTQLYVLFVKAIM
jgi:hypothetical protein